MSVMQTKMYRSVELIWETHLSLLGSLRNWLVHGYVGWSSLLGFTCNLSSRLNHESQQEVTWENSVFSARITKFLSPLSKYYCVYLRRSK